MANSSYTLDTRVLDKLIKNMDGNMTDAVAKAAFMIEGRAKIKTPVDTGALRAGIGVSMQRNSGIIQAMAAARARNPDAVIVELPKPRDTHTAYIGPTVAYGQEVELGSHNRSGRPYLQPAVRETEADFQALLAEAVRP